MYYRQANLHRQSLISTMTCSTEESESSCHFTTVPSSKKLSPAPILDDDDVVLRTRPGTSTARTNNKKRVSIDERVQVRTTIALHEMSQEEIDAVWYSPEEFHQITESCCKQIIKLNRGETLKDKKYCARGLESHIHIRSIGKSMNRRLAYQVVFDEQERQWQKGSHNDEVMSRVYLAASSSSCLWANVIGLADQKEADNIYDDESLS